MSAIVCGPGPVSEADRAAVARFADLLASQPASRGLLSALAIAYSGIGVHDRAARLADAAAHVGRPLSSTTELTAEEARALRRHLPRCAPETCRSTTAVGTPPVVAPAASTGCSCTGGGRPGVRSACDPAGVGRYCPPRACWCGHCPWWAPAPPPNYAAAIAKLTEEGAR